LKAADRVIRNEGSIDETRREARKVFQELKGLALQKRNETCARQDSVHRSEGGEKRGL
jgi:hypothetical protein